MKRRCAGTDTVMRVALAWALVVASAPDLRAQDTPVSGNPIEGRRIFAEARCIRCHAIWGNGGHLGPDFSTAGAGRSVHQLAGMFWNHTPRMIESVRERGFAWPQFSEAQLADIISYIYYVKLFDEPGNAVLGQRWFAEKGCGDCHAVGGAGGTSAPALDRYARYLAPIVLAEGLWNHGPTMQRQQAARGRTMSFFGSEMADIQAYIRERSTLRNREVALLEPPDPANGAALFVRKDCARCHGRTGGGGDGGPNLRTGTEGLRVSEIAGRIWNHAGAMASTMAARGISFPEFQGNEMSDVIAFLYYLRFYETAGDQRRGERLFADKGCMACHGIGEQAGVGPDLSRSASVLTPLGLATAMWDHAPAMYDQIVDADVEWPRFEGNEMRDLAAYLRAIAVRQGQAGGR